MDLERILSGDARPDAGSPDERSVVIEDHKSDKSDLTSESSDGDGILGGEPSSPDPNRQALDAAAARLRLREKLKQEAEDKAAFEKGVAEAKQALVALTARNW